jgi:hypothetical protein
VRGCRALVVSLSLLNAAAAWAADAPAGADATAKTAQAAPAKTHPPFTARLAGQMLLGAKWGSVSLHPYGADAAIGWRIGIGKVVLTPAIGFDWVGGRTEYGLRFSNSTIFGELELCAPRPLNWLRLGLGAGFAQPRLERATTGGSIVDRVLHAHLLLSADVLRLDDRFTFWLGAGVRLEGNVGSFPLLGGVRI